jgi:Protein  of unknown function (DUF3018)
MTEQSRIARNVRRHRAQRRAQGLRVVQFWLPDTSTPEFKAQVAHDIAAVAKLDPEDEALLDTLEQWAAEDFQE